MQEEANTVADNSARLGLRIHRGKNKVLKNNAAVSATPIIMEGDGLKDMICVTYQIVLLTKKRGSDEREQSSSK